MKTIESKDLVIGQEYYDIPDMDLNEATVLQFIGYDEFNNLVFIHVRGIKIYIQELDGTILFDKSEEFFQP